MRVYRNIDGSSQQTSSLSTDSSRTTHPLSGTRPVDHDSGQIYNPLVTCPECSKANMVIPGTTDWRTVQNPLLQIFSNAGLGPIAALAQMVGSLTAPGMMPAFEPERITAQEPFPGAWKDPYPFPEQGSTPSAMTMPL